MFDFKKEYKDLYAPKDKPNIVNVLSANYIAVRGKGNPNADDGEYRRSIELLFAIAYTLKMSYKGDYKINGYFEYVVPPLEGLWWIDGNKTIDPASHNKDSFNFISIIRLPDFVTKKDFEWAVKEATKKKKQDFSKVEFFTYNEGQCVQCLHIGSYDTEPKTIASMEKFAAENGCQTDISNIRYHHEIYLSDPSKCDVDKLKTVIRYPIKSRH